MAPNEQALQRAIADLLSGRFKSQRACAKEHGVSLETLRDRMKGATSSQESHQHQQRLSPLQEGELVQWILEEDARGFPPSHVSCSRNGLSDFTRDRRRYTHW